jgi:hypothetical protein
MFRRISETPGEVQGLVTLASEDGLCLVTITGTTAEAQAARIMALSDMLAALKLAMDDGFLAGEALDAVEAAVAKAEGRADG